MPGLGLREGEVAVEVRNKVSMSVKEFPMLECAGTDISHLVLTAANVKRDEGRCLPCPLTEGEEPKEMSRRYGSGCAAFRCPTDGGGVVCKHSHMFEFEIRLYGF